MSLDAIRAKAKPSQTSITLFLDGEVDAEVRRLTAELNALGDGDSLEGNPQRAEVEQELNDLYDTRGKDSEQTFVFRTIDARRWARLEAENPGRDGVNEAWNQEKFPAAIMSECLVGPKLTATEVKELEELVSPGQWDLLWNTCWLLNKGVNSAVPKSVKPSGGTRNSGATSTSSAPAESLTASSLDES